ncbi:MAG: hypothetical protein AUK47_12850 [Deltaproteobacteria bacterium CG2_30_63_29]|nr:MAG: hypothetical protein AUK47_12850 [Deltaproteobacteria bacterium CG2_30_63_29]PJB34504.1 MAG: hypothetical protein CO108_28175 [Deltaproteobacteria bacterium CG_4_9_14_3_um_filter_63_12]
MSDDKKDPSVDDVVAETPPEETYPGESSESADAGPEIPDFGLDPRTLMSDPFGAMMKIMSDPNAMKTLNDFVNSAKGKEMITKGMENPAIKQMMGGNPMFDGALKGALRDGFKMPPGFGGSPVSKPAAASKPAPVKVPESVEPELDEPVIPLLDGPHGQLAFPVLAKVASFDELLAELPEEARVAILRIAEKRLRHHLGEAGLQRLAALATAQNLTRPMDVLVNQGAFVGEVVWYAIVELEEGFAPGTFVGLASHALECVTHACGYRVASFVTQLLQYLLDSEAVTVTNVRHAIWSLSGQPEDGVDGVFEISWEDVDTLVEGALEATLPPPVLTALLVGLLGWRALDPSERSGAFEGMLDRMDPERQEAVLGVLGEFLSDAKDLEGLRASQMPEVLTRSIAERIATQLGIERALVLAAGSWKLKPPASAHVGLLRALDVSWAQANGKLRTGYLDNLLKEGDRELRTLVYQVAAAWDPHTYLERAAQDPAVSISKWAVKELEALR